MVQDMARISAADLIPQEVLAHVPGYAAASTTARVALLHGGTVNKSYSVETGAGRFVVRIHDVLARTLGADHEREAQLHAAAAAAGLAPALVHVDAAHRFMVMEYIAGRVWTAQDFARPERLTQLGAALYTLHQVVPPVVAPYDIPALLEMHYERLSAAAPDERKWFDELMDRATAALEACRTRQRPKVLIHNDLYHSNLIGDERLYLLDWEYAAVTDPLFDLAGILAYYPQADAHAGTLLQAARLADVATPEMLRHAAWVYVLVSYFWYRSRRLGGPPSSPATEAAEQALLTRLG
jgi:aminoglycoside phosphotransferase (APT) family kinase protein